MSWNVRVLCQDGFVMEALVVADSEEQAWEQGAGLARLIGRTSVTEFAEAA